jgi:hypothetical protein
MKRYTLIPALLLLLCAVAAAQDLKPALLSTPELKQIVPNAYFFRGQSATVQIRNASGLRMPGGKVVFAALVDTSGYAQDVAEKYQGLFVTEVKIAIGDKEVAPGAYGFGFSNDGKFILMDVGANDLLAAATTVDEQLLHPVPLKIQDDGKGLRFYAGRKWVALKVQ